MVQIIISRKEREVLLELGYTDKEINKWKKEREEYYSIYLPEELQT